MTTPGRKKKCRQNQWEKRHLQPLGASQTRNRPLCTIGNTAGQNRLNSCRGKPFDLGNELELERQKGNPG